MKNLYGSLILCFIVFNSLASTDTLKTDTAKTSLTLATIYSSNANYYGQTTEGKLPYVLTNATLRFKSGFSLSAGAYKLLNIGKGVSEVDLGVGYNYKITKNLSGAFSYTRSFFSKDSTLLQVANTNAVSASLSYDWNLFNTDLNADYAFGLDQNLFLTLSNSKLIDLGSLFSEKDYISLEPSIEIVGGVQLSQDTTYTPVRRRFLDVFNRPPPKATINKSYPFDILTYNMRLPLAYNRASYILETSYQVSILSKKIAGGDNKPRSFFNLSFYYMF